MQPSDYFVLCLLTLSALFIMSTESSLISFFQSWWKLPRGNSMLEYFINIWELLIKNIDLTHFIPDEPERGHLLSEYDFIIVGAGTAGCVLANRLSEITSWNILIVEAGGDEIDLMDIPLAVSYLQLTPFDWKYKTEPSNEYCAGLENKQCRWPRGKVLGGSSVLNYMIYTRGSPEDYNDWERMGNVGWGWDNVLPYFKKVENFNIPSEFDSRYHSRDGNIHVEHAPFRTQMVNAWIDAAQQYGFKYVNHNGAEQSGVSHLQFSMKNGARHSSNKGYLLPVIQRSNLHVSKRSLVTKILFDKTNTRAIGIELENKKGKQRIFARREVILSAGAINSPQLLMLSGIGPRSHLQAMNISVVRDLPVGRNLMDHIATGGLHFLIESQGLSFKYIVNHPEEVMNWMFNHKGPLTVPGGCEGILYTDLNDIFNTSRRPDVELLLISGGLQADPSIKHIFNYDQETYEELFRPLENSSTFIIFPMLMRPKSKGQILLQSKNPKVHPKIYPNYFQYEQDIQKIIDVIKIAIGISEQPALKRLNTRIYSKPIKQCLKYGAFGTDAYFACQTRQFTYTIYHYSGTCKMGVSNDPTAVVDPWLRVHGIRNLRVIDASIMPEIVSVHTNAPTYMIAEKGADMIKQDWGV